MVIWVVVPMKNVAQALNSFLETVKEASLPICVCKQALVCSLESRILVIGYGFAYSFEGRYGDLLHFIVSRAAPHARHRNQAIKGG